MKRILFLLALAVAFVAACKKDKSATDAKAAFTTAKNNYYLSQNITFNNTSANGKTYTWDFGDGQSSTNQSPSHSYTTSGAFSVKLTVDGKSTASKVIKIYDGTASYQVNNKSSYDFPLVSFALDPSNNLIDFVDHGIINSGGISDTVYTSDAKIYVGGTLPDDSVFIAINPHTIIPATNNILILADTSQIIVNSLKQKQTFAQFLRSKSTAGKKMIIQQVGHVKHINQ